MVESIAFLKLVFYLHERGGGGYFIPPLDGPHTIRSPIFGSIATLNKNKITKLVSD